MEINAKGKFSFPGTPEDEFEFGCITPTSPSSDPSKTVSPADQFFLNGRLLPHSFPVQARRSISECNSRATTSRTSSIGSKDSLSLLSSRSNSTNSSRSGTTCSSARTSASDISERKVFQRKLASRTFSARERVSGNGYSKTAGYGSSQRWQFITPAPVLGPSLSMRRRSSGELKLSPKKKNTNNVSDQRLGFCQRVLRSFVKSCRACHAMEGAAVEDDDLASQLEIK